MVAKLLGGLLLLAAAAILTPPAAAPLPPTGDSHVIADVRVIDVEAGTVGPPVSVVVRDGRIASIGAGIRAPGLPVIDGQGGYLVPGFWDMHVHSFQLSPQLHLPLHLSHGVTAVRDMMDCPEPADTLIACAADKARWTREAEAGRMAGPRFVGVASFLFNDPDMAPADAARRAADYRARGITALKVYDRTSPAVHARLAAEARGTGMVLVGHLPRAIPLETAVAAGQSSFEHAHLFVRHCFDGADDWRRGRLTGGDVTALYRRMVERHEPAACARAFALMAARGAAFVPTHVTREEDARPADPDFLAAGRARWLDPLSGWAWGDDQSSTAAQFPGPSGAAALEAYFRHGLALTGAAHRAGVRVLVGTDTILGGPRYHDELAHLVAAGLSPADVLRAATIEAARHQGQETEAGTVMVGKRADLVLLGANPLADIRNSRRIRMVMLGGRPYDRALLDRLDAHVASQAQSPANAIRTLWGFAWSRVNSEL